MTISSNSHVDIPTDPDAEERGRAAQTPEEIPAKGWKDIALRVKNEVNEDHTVLTAAGVAFFGFLALIPALAALVSLAGLVWEADTVTERVEDSFGSLPTEAQELLSAQLESLAGNSTGSLSTSLIISVALSLWAASSGMGHLVEGVNVAYDEHDDRNFVVKKLLALALTLGAIVFVVVAVTGLALLPNLLDESGLPSGVQTLIGLAFWPLLAAGFAVGLAVLYRVGPDRDAPQWRWVTWGSVVAVALWVMVSVGFRIYANNFGSYSETYGSLAAVVVLMMFLFLTSLTVLIGAQINSEMEHQTARDTTVGPERPLGTRGAVVADTVGRPADDNDDG